MGKDRDKDDRQVSGLDKIREKNGAVEASQEEEERGTKCYSKQEWHNPCPCRPYSPARQTDRRWMNE